MPLKIPHKGYLPRELARGCHGRWMPPTSSVGDRIPGRKACLCQEAISEVRDRQDLRIRVGVTVTIGVR